MCKVLPGCVIAHSMISASLYIPGLARDWFGWAGVGIEMGWGCGWNGDGKWGV